MKNERFLTPITVLIVTLIHVGVIGSAWYHRPSENAASTNSLTFVDLGSIYGDDKPMADGAPAPLETSPEPPKEQPKKEEKPKPKKPEPKPEKSKSQKIKTVQRDDRPADIFEDTAKDLKPVEPIKTETPVATTTVSNPKNRSADGIQGGGGGNDPDSLRPGNPESNHKGGDGMGAKGPSTDIVDGGMVDIPYPPYPARAREEGEEGEVRIEIVVEPNGIISSTKFVKRSGSRALDNAALNAVKNAKVSPRKVNGIPVKSRYIAPFKFKLS